MFAEQPEWTHREHVEEMTMRKTIEVKRVPDEGKKGGCIDEKDTLESVIIFYRCEVSL